MRRVLLAAGTVALVAAMSFGVGWFVSGADERTAVSRPASVAHLKPLPVPRVIILDGPWADPHPTVDAPTSLRIAGGGYVATLYRALGVDLETGARLVR